MPPRSGYFPDPFDPTKDDLGRHIHKSVPVTADGPVNRYRNPRPASSSADYLAREWLSDDKQVRFVIDPHRGQIIATARWSDESAVLNLRERGKLDRRAVAMMISTLTQMLIEEDKRETE